MTTIRLSDHGILPDTDITLALDQLMQEHPYDTEFVFETADYYFRPHEEMHFDYRLSNSDVLPERVLGIRLREHRGCILNGNGARLFFEGQMQAITLDRCKDITIKDLTIDWKKPLVAEGRILEVGERYADFYIDPEAFPHRFENGTLFFDVGAEEWYPLHRGFIVFDENNNSVARATGDMFVHQGVEELGGSVYRYYFEATSGMKPGQTVVLRHNARRHAGIFSEKCEDLVFSDITVHSCGGLGCLAQFCHNLTYERVFFLPNRAAGRRISNGRDDGMHLTSNSGHITVTECSFLGLMDDPINVHGCCVTASRTLDSRTLLCRYRHEQARNFLYWAEPGDEISFIRRDDMHAIGTAKALSYEITGDGEFVLRFREELPKEITELANKEEALALDNLTHTASFTCTKNRFGSCRARGILVSTPKRVQISQNYFCSSGSAILVAGDSNGWFESGECHDVEISDNVFTDLCLSSMYQFCDGVISICPVVPNPKTTLPYHKNIRIFGNKFDSPATPVLYAYATGGLVWKDNIIFISPSAEPWHPSSSWMKLQYCSDVRIEEDLLIGACAGLKLGMQARIEAENCERVTMKTS